MAYPFFAMLSRLKFIHRWALMRNSSPETLSDHSIQVAYIAHALAVIGNRRLNKNYNAERVALLSMYHDVTEILTGDMPTPIKYKNEALRHAYKEVEYEAAGRLCEMLPEDIMPDFEALLSPKGEDAELALLVKAADKISALIKCLEEKKVGNTEFKTAEKENLKQIKKLGCKEAEIFISEFLDAYSCNLDELTSF